MSFSALGISADGSRLSVTSLMQTNCLLLTPLLLTSEGRGGRNFPYVHVLEHLHQQGYVRTYRSYHTNSVA